MIKRGEALSESADILIYGCDVAADAAGQSLVETIKDLTGADVAASVVTNFANSIIAGNTASGYDVIDGPLESAGYNIIGDYSGSGFDFSDQRNVDPQIGSLANNGGALMTHKPSATEAINGADWSLTATTDQRGYLRGDGNTVKAEPIRRRLSLRWWMISPRAHRAIAIPASTMSPKVRVQLHPH